MVNARPTILAHITVLSITAFVMGCGHGTDSTASREDEAAVDTASAQLLSAPIGYDFSEIVYPGASSTDAWAINDRGDVVGQYVLGGVTSGFQLRDGAFQSITFPGSSFTQATGVSENGDIVGNYRIAGDPVTHAYRLDCEGTFTTIDVPGAVSSLPRDINLWGHVVFEAQIPRPDTTPRTAAFVLRNGSYTEILPPASLSPTGATTVTFAYASGVDNWGRIVGRFDYAGGNAGYMRDAFGGFSLLQFPGAPTSAALGINEFGHVVGGYAADGQRRGYVKIGSTYTPLDVPGCTGVPVGGAVNCTTPRKINVWGVIVGGFGAGGTASKGFFARPIR
jgi:uncharacterized membrane protein